MAKTVPFNAKHLKADKANRLRKNLEELKDELALLLQEYEDAGAGDDFLDPLTDALDALEDASECLGEVCGEE